MAEVSVLMPVYNGEAHLREAVESILTQSFGDFEIILINDGSTDQSGTILEEYAQQDQRIVLIHQDNRGCVESLNRALSLATAPLIARMDSDDISLPDRFKKQIAYLQKNANVALVGGNITLINKNGQSIRNVRFPTSSQDIRKEMKRRCALAHSSIMSRKVVFDSMGGYRPEYEHSEDYDLWLRILEHHDIGNVPDTILLYRQHSQNISSQNHCQQAIAATAARMAHRRRLKNRSDPTRSIQQRPNWDYLTRISESNADKVDVLKLLMSMKFYAIKVPAAKTDAMPSIMNAMHELFQREGVIHGTGLMFRATIELVRDGTLIRRFQSATRSEIKGLFAFFRSTA